MNTLTSQDKPPVVCLMGPTASGKTPLALELMQHFPFEIISVDSVMVYRGMDIGTAKPSAHILKKIPHHLINIRNPEEPYSVGEFQKEVCMILQEIASRGKIPLLCGGTMLYFHALMEGLASLPQANPTIRAFIKKSAEAKGWHALHLALSKIDKAASERIHPNDSQRIQRAWEVYLMTGETITSQRQRQHSLLSEYTVHAFILAPERKVLHERIAIRLQDMLQKGLVEEVKQLCLEKDLSDELPAMRSVGYREVAIYLSGKLSYKAMCEYILASTRQLAKRQITWLRSLKKELPWFNPAEINYQTSIMQWLKKRIPRR